MKIPAQHHHKCSIYVAASLVFLALSTYSAEGSSIVFTGTTLGAFNGGAFSSTATLNGLTFTGTSFVAYTDKFGHLNVIGPSFTLGTFSLTSLTGLTASDTFNLELVLNPAGGWSPNPMIIQASILPSFEFQSVSINFDVEGTDHPFSFSNGTFTGTAGIELVTSGPGLTVYGNIDLHRVTPPVPTPEPGAFLLLGTGIGALLLKLALSRGESQPT